jgi:hypothetical protein
VQKPAPQLLQAPSPACSGGSCLISSSGPNTEWTSSRNLGHCGVMACCPLDSGSQPCFVPPHPDHPIWRRSRQQWRSRISADAGSSLSNQKSLSQGDGSALTERPVGFNDGTIVPRESWPTNTPAQVVSRAALREPRWKGVIKCVLLKYGRVLCIYLPSI